MFFRRSPACASFPWHRSVDEAPHNKGFHAPPPSRRRRKPATTSNRAHFGLSLGVGQKVRPPAPADALFELPPCISHVRQTHAPPTGVQRAPALWRCSLVTFCHCWQKVTHGGFKLPKRLYGPHQLKKSLHPLYISPFLCYNTPRCHGEAGEIPARARRRVAHRPANRQVGSVLPPAAREEQGHWKLPKLPRRPTDLRPVEIPEHPANKPAEHSRENRDDRLGGKSIKFQRRKQT